MTFAIVVLICLSASRASSLFISWTTPRTELRTTTNMMMITSAKSSLPCIPAIAALMTAATINMMIIGSASCPANRFHIGVLGASFSLFGPYFDWSPATTPVSSPRVESVPYSDTTDSTLS